MKKNGKLALDILADFGFKQADIARKLNISRASVSAWKYGRVPPKHFLFLDGLTAGEFTIRLNNRQSHVTHSDAL